MSNPSNELFHPTFFPPEPRVPVAGIEVAKNERYYFTGDGLGKIEMPLKVRLTAVTGEQKETVISFTLTSDIPRGVQFSGFKAGRNLIHILIRSFMHFSLSLIQSLARASNSILSFLLFVHSLLFRGLLFRSFVSPSLARSFVQSSG